MKIISQRRIYTVAVAAATVFAAWSGPGVRELSPTQPDRARIIPHRITESGNANYAARKRATTAVEGFRRAPQFVETPTPERLRLQQRVAASQKKLRGFMTDNSLWYGGTPEYGVYELSTTPGEAEYTALHLDPKMYVMDAIYTGSTVWTSYAEEDPTTFQVLSMTYYTYNPDTWQVLNEQVGDKSLQFVTSAWSPTDEMAYVTYGGAGTTFGAFMVEDGSLMSFGSTTKRLTAMACHENGTIYGIDEAGNLVKINSMTGKNDKIVGNTGVKSYWRTSGTIDSENNIFYYIDCQQSKSSLYAIDLETAVATKLYDFSNCEQLIGLYVVADSTPATIPASPTDAALNFEGSSLTGNLTFTVPTTHYDGTAGSGDVSYTVTIDDGRPVTTPTSWGESVTVPLTIVAPGNHTVKLTIDNETGSSRAVTLSQWIGGDAPSAVSGASLTYANGKFTIKWNAPTEGANGGYINPESLRYTVVRNNDNVTVAEDITATRIEDAVSEPVNRIVGYTYTITPKADGIAGEPTTTSKKSIGYLLPPYENNFETSAQTAGYTVLDANGDGKKWGYNSSSKAMRIQYNSSKAMDDWVFTPEFQLEAGKSYTFSFKTRAHNSTLNERIEAAISTGTKANTVVETIVPPTDVVGTDWATLSGEFTPQTSGRYRLGLHGISDKDKYYLYATGITVTAGASSSTPAGATDMSVTPAADGSLKATITFNAPSTDVANTPLSTIERIELKRNDVLIHTFDSPAPGARLSYIDNDAPARNVTYSVTAFNAAGAGATTRVSAFIGYDVPKPVTNLTVSYGANTGQAVLNWTAPTHDINGLGLSADALTYKIIRIVDESTVTVAENATGDSFTDNAVAATGEQQFVNYQVIAQTTGGASEGVSTKLIPLGKPHNLPFAESFVNGHITYEWGLDSSNAAAGWLLGQDTSIDQISSEDNDNGLAIMQAMTANSWASLISGLISVPADGTPMLTFAYFAYDTANKLEVQVSTDPAQQPQTLKEIVLNSGAADQWNYVSVDMSAYKGQNIQLIFKGTVVDATVIVIDNIRLKSVRPDDLAVRNVSMPARVAPGSGFEVVATVENNGQNMAQGYSVGLIADDEVVATLSGTPLNPGEATRFTFDRTMPPTSAESVTYKVRVDYAADNNPADNVSASYEVRLADQGWPVPTGLAATEESGGSVMLQWDAPDLTVAPMQRITDDVEEYTPYSTGLAGSAVFDDFIGGWTMIDNDGVTPYAITSMGEIMNFPNSARPVSFMVMEPAIFNSPIWDSHSGSKVFVSFSSQYAANDDWMISPRLDGSAQTVTFFARALTTYYGEESFQVYYSSTDTRITSFTRLSSVNSVPESWTEYTAELPEGARYFAIRCTSNDAFALLVDDISFTPAHPADGLELVGYNVYRDGVCITPAPVAATNFVDENVDNGNHTYHVTAVYNRGESAVSDPCGTTVTSIGNIAAANVKVFTSAQCIVIENAADMDVTVTNAAGIIIAKHRADGRLEINVENGIYIVTVGSKTFKVIVR